MHPCPICKRPDWCSVSVDGRLVACRRVEQGAAKNKQDKNGSVYYLHRLLQARDDAREPATPGTSGVRHNRAGADTLDAVYSSLLARLTLSEAHRAALRARGLPEEAIDAGGYRSLHVRGRARIVAELRELHGECVVSVPGVITREREGRRYLTLAGAAGLLIPIRDLSGRIVALLSRRDDASDGRGKYRYLSSAMIGGPGPGAPVNVPKGIAGPAEIVRITEGALKADIAHVLSGVPTIGLPGVTSWRPALPILRELGTRTVRIAFDADAVDNPAVARALDAVVRGLDVEGYAVELERWPVAHKGIDDALAVGAVIEVVPADAAPAVIAEIVAEGTAGEAPQAPSALDRLDDVIAEGAEGIFRDHELLTALAQLAETDPAEWACVRARLRSAGVRLRDLDTALTPLRREIRAERPVLDAAGCYRVSAGRIVRDIAMREGGTVEVPLATWHGRIVEEIIRDDGAERSVALAVEGALVDGTPLPRVEIASDDWPYMRWPVERWGTRAVVLAGAATADHLRCALQLLSGDVLRRTIYAHTGWREINGCWLYLHAGGAIGASGPVKDITVALPDALAGYKLPDPSDGRALPDAVRASLRVLDLAPDRITVALLGAVFRAVLGSADCALHLSGPTGQGKSELAALAQQHHGAALDARHLPGSWSSTGNALEGLAFAAAHAVLVVDDFAPGGTAADVARMHREADRLLRAQGNHAGRLRMRTDSSLRPAKSPRGIILSTGEDVPRGQSLRARMLVLELAPGELNWSSLSACQRDGADGRYAEALAGYLRWLAPQYAAVCIRMRAEVAELRDRARSEGQHARTPGIVADLAFGWRNWLAFAVDVCAIDRAERDTLERRVWRALMETAAAQAEHAAAADPVEQFLRLLDGALASGRAHCAASMGNAPEDAESWGWRDGNPLGRRIGWVGGSDLYLEPEAAYAEAQELARQQGDSLPIAPRTLWRRMGERGVLASRDQARQRYTVRRRLDGRERREVIHLRADALSAAQPSPPSPPSQTLDQRAEYGDGSGDSCEDCFADCPPQPSPEPRKTCGGSDAGDGGDGPTNIGSATAPNYSRTVCMYPAHRRRWRSVHGAILCGICVPPCRPDVVEEWLDGPPDESVTSK